jgi:hypothetical protein
VASLRRAEARGIAQISQRIHQRAYSAPVLTEHERRSIDGHRVVRLVNGTQRLEEPQVVSGARRFASRERRRRLHDN